MRESTNFQDPESQYEECLKYCNENEFEVIRRYQDIASGKSNTRKGFLQMLQDMEEDIFDVIVLWELSRSTRDFLTYKQMILRMTELGKELYSLQEGKLTEDDIDSEFSNDIRALVNSHERKRVSRRVKFRKQFTKSQGNWTGGIPPLGYKLVDSQLVIDEEEALKVKEIFQLFIEGNSCTSIAKRFGFKDSKKIMRLLENPIYIGQLKQNEYEMINDKKVHHTDYKTVKGKHEPIISEDLFNLCNSLKRDKRKVSYKENDFILKNVVDYHGQRMYPSFKNKQKPYYAGRIGDSYIQAEYLEKIVLESLTNEINKFTVLNEVDTQREKISSRKIFYNKEIEKLKTKEDKLLRSYLNDKISEENFNKFNDEVKNSIKSYEEKLKELSLLEQKQINSKDNCKLLKEYLLLLKNTSDRDKIKKILNAIIYEIRLINDFRVMVITNLF